MGSSVGGRETGKDRLLNTEDMNGELFFKVLW